MGFLNSDSLPYLVEKLTDGANIKIAGNNKGDRVSTVVSKISEKANDVTKATFQQVTNTTTLFKTGTGDVDVSASMEEGFGNVGVKGNTLINLCSRITEKANWITVDGNYVTISNPTGTGNISFSINLKPSTTYTLIVEVVRKDDSIRGNIDLFPDTYQELGTFDSLGMKLKVFTTPSNISTLTSLRYYCSFAQTGTIKVSLPLLLEGDWTNKEIPSYFEGIKSVGEPTSDGKYKVEFISTNTSKNDSHKTHFFLNEPLRKKNDSVYDEILDDGTLIRRCGQFVLEDNDAKQTISSNQVSDITQAIYELETPIVEKNAPLTLRLYKEGYISLNTIPTETTHMILLNKSAQIENSIKEIKSLKKRVDDLEGICGDIILDTSRKLSLLEFDYNLTRVSMEEKE